MISLRVMITVIAMMLGLANVTKGFTVTIVQVNFQTCNWWFADQNLPIELFINFVKLWQQRNNYNFCCCFYSFFKKSVIEQFIEDS